MRTDRSAFESTKLPITRHQTAGIDVSIIIINWNSKDYLRRCLESVRRTSTDLAYEIIIIDNASYDGCAEMLASEFPEALMIQSEENMGFARANNFGVTRSHGNSILFLNPDTIVVGNAIRKLEQAIEGNEDVGVVGAHILNSDLSLQTTCIMPVPTLLNQLLDIDPLRRFFTWRKLRSGSSKRENLRRVSAVSGACMMVRRSAFEEVGQFCSDYFMYVEDIDLCVRMERTGWKVCHLQSAEIIHYGGSSSMLQTSSSFSSVTLHKSVQHFFLLHRGSLYAALYRPTVVLGASVRIVVLSLLHLLGRRTSSEPPSIKKWNSLLTWSLGRNV